MFLSHSVLAHINRIIHRVMSGHCILVRLFKYCVRNSVGKTTCGVGCRVFAAVADVIDFFCEKNIENQQAFLHLALPYIMEYGGSNEGKKACNCDNNSFLQVKFYRCNILPYLSLTSE